MMNFGIYTEIGKNRKVNEDFVICDSDKDLYIVCDGMGGHSAGELASMEAANWLLKTLRLKLRNDLSAREISGVFIEAFDNVNHHIYEYSKKDKNFKDMGTTAVVAYIDKDELYICHIGDSRAYLINDGYAIQLTKDHSYVQQLVEEGEITVEEAKSHPKRNMITQALGTDTVLSPEIIIKPFVAGDVLLLCTDGLSQFIENREMVKIIKASSSLQTAAEALVACAIKKGSFDDVSTIVINLNKKEKKGEWL